MQVFDEMAVFAAVTAWVAHDRPNRLHRLPLLMRECHMHRDGSFSSLLHP